MLRWPLSRHDEPVEFATPAGRVQAVVRRLAFRVHLGPVRCELGRLRVVRVSPPDRPLEVVAVPVPADPRTVLLGGTLLVWAACAAVIAVRGRKEQPRGAPRIPRA